ncbi:MAG: aminotransferase class III-fold pyridoxal phosphate-dependent enzyme, partial [Iodobacter sp.]
MVTAVADKVIELINSPELLAGVRQRHELLVEGLHQINQKHGVFKEIRGSGLLIGAELAPVLQGRAKDIVTLGAQHGVVLLMAGPNVLRLLPSLVIPLSDMTEGLRRLEAVIAELVPATVPA